MNSRRKDLGAPVDGFFARQPAHLEPITDALRKLVAEAAPRATSSIKWGMPFYELDGVMLCAIGAHKKHVNLILPGSYDDPDGLLEGEGKTGKHLKITSLDELPRAQVKKWLKAAAKRARGK